MCILSEVGTQQDSSPIYPDFKKDGTKKQFDRVRKGSSPVHPTSQSSSLNLSLNMTPESRVPLVTKNPPQHQLLCFYLLTKVQVYSLISSLKTYHPTFFVHLTPWSLDLFIRVPFQLHGEHTVLQPFRRIELIVHIAISVLPGTHFQVKHLRVKCLAQGHNILTMSQD